MIYRLHLYREEAGSEGYEYHATKQHAQERRALLIRSGYDPRFTTIDSERYPAEHGEVLRLLSRWAAHPDHG